METKLQLVTPVVQMAPGQGLQYIIMMKEAVSPQWPGSGQM